MGQRKKGKSARNYLTWIEKGYNEKDAKFEASKRMPGTYEYFRYFKNLSEEDTISAISEYKSNGACTLKNMIRRYSEEEGTKRFNSYREKQALTNTFEYKRDKYGWTSEQFDEYNKSRSVTLENMIKRHGKEEGEKKWKQYRDRQAYVGCTEEYFIEKLGEVEGKLKYKEVNLLKSHSFESILHRCKGDTKLAEMIWNIKFASGNINYSKISQELFNTVIERFDFSKREIYFAEHNYEWYMQGDKRGALLDFFDKSTGKVIEFYGDFWHANPQIYTENMTVAIPAEPKLAAEIWKEDETRIAFIKQFPYITDVLIVWESDYRTDKNKTIQTCINFLQNNDE